MLSQLWSYKLSKIRDAYAYGGTIYNNLLYFMVSSYTGEGFSLVELDLECGKGKVVFSYKRSVQLAVFDAGQIYMTESGNVLHYDMGQDQVIFQQPLPVNFAGRMLVSGSRLYVGVPDITSNKGCEKGIYCLDINSGRVLWHAAPDAPLYWKMYSWKNTLIFSSHKGIYSINSDGGVKYVLDGELPQIVLAGNSIFTEKEEDLLLLDAETGEETARLAAGHPVDTLFYLNGAVICGTGDAVCKYKIEDGKIVRDWVTELDHEHFPISDISFHDDFLYFTNNKKKLYKMDFRTGAYDAGKLDLRSPTRGELLFHGDNMYLLSYETGRVYCYDISEF